MTVRIVFGLIWALALVASASAIWTANTGWPLALCAAFAAIHVLMELPSRPESRVLALQYSVIRGFVGLVCIFAGAYFLYGSMREFSGTSFINRSERVRPIFRVLSDFGGNEAVGVLALVLGIGGIAVGIRILRKGFAPYAEKP